MSKVLISIIDINGKKIDTIVNKNYQVGYYSINWDGNHLPSGVYFIVLDNSDRKLINKVLLLK